MWLIIEVSGQSVKSGSVDDKAESFDACGVWIYLHSCYSLVWLAVKISPVARALLALNHQQLAILLRLNLLQANALNILVCWSDTDGKAVLLKSLCHLGVKTDGERLGTRPPRIAKDLRLNFNLLLAPLDFVNKLDGVDGFANLTMNFLECKIWVILLQVLLHIVFLVI